MKKLTFFFFPIMCFFGCEIFNEEEEPPADTSGYNCTPDGCFADFADAQYLTIEDCNNYCNPDDYDDDNNDSDPVNWSFSLTINGNTYAAQGQLDSCMSYIEIMGLGEAENSGTSYYGGGGLMISFIIEDLTESSYISGGYISLNINVANAFVGNNSAILTGANDYTDYFSFEDYAGNTQTNYYVSEPNITFGQQFTQAHLPMSEYSGIDLLITSLGQECGGGNIEGSYSGILYTIDNPNLSTNPAAVYDIPVEIEFVFSVPRLSYM